MKFSGTQNRVKPLLSKPCCIKKIRSQSTLGYPDDVFEDLGRTVEPVDTELEAEPLLKVLCRLVN